MRNWHSLVCAIVCAWSVSGALFMPVAARHDAFSSSRQVETARPAQRSSVLLERVATLDSSFTGVRRRVLEAGLAETGGSALRAPDAAGLNPARLAGGSATGGATSPPLAGGNASEPIQPYIKAKSSPESDAAFVTICSAVKDQHVDVREWIVYHRAIGVDRFYLHDTGSVPPMDTVLADFIESGLVHYRYDAATPHRAGTHGPQITVYERCLESGRVAHPWMAFIDVDEFVVLRDATPDLPTLLREFEDAGALVLNWVVFGSSGLEKKPRTNTLASFWRCAPDGHPENLHVKSVVRPARVDDTRTDPHHFKYRAPYVAKSADGETVAGPKSSRQATARVALHHYAIKSREEFGAKMARGSGMGNQKTMAFFHYVDNYTTGICDQAIDLGNHFASWADYALPGAGY